MDVRIDDEYRSGDVEAFTFSTAMNEIGEAQLVMKRGASVSLRESVEIYDVETVDVDDFSGYEDDEDIYDGDWEHGAGDSTFVGASEKGLFTILDNSDDFSDVTVTNTTEDFESHAAGDIDTLTGPLGTWAVGTTGTGGTAEAIAGKELELTPTDADGTVAATVTLIGQQYPVSLSMILDEDVGGAGSLYLLLGDSATRITIYFTGGTIVSSVGLEAFTATYTPGTPFTIAFTFPTANTFTLSVDGGAAETKVTSSAFDDPFAFITLRAEGSGDAWRVEDVIAPVGASIRDTATTLGTWNAWTEAAGCSFTAYLDGAGRRWGRLVDANVVDTIQPVLTWGTARTWVAGDYVEYTFQWLVSESTYPRVDIRCGTDSIINIYYYDSTIRAINSGSVVIVFSGLTAGDEWTIRVIYASDTTYTVKLWVNGTYAGESAALTTNSARQFSAGDITNFRITGGNTQEFDALFTDLRASWLPGTADIAYLPIADADDEMEWMSVKCKHGGASTVDRLVAFGTETLLADDDFWVTATLGTTTFTVTTDEGDEAITTTDIEHTWKIHRITDTTFDFYFDGTLYNNGGSHYTVLAGDFTAADKLVALGTTAGVADATLTITVDDVEMGTREVYWEGTVRKVEQGRRVTVFARDPLHQLEHTFCELENTETTLTARSYQAITVASPLPDNAPVFINMKQDETDYDDDTGATISLRAGAEPTTDGSVSSGDYEDTWLDDSTNEVITNSAESTIYTLVRASVISGEVKEAWIKLDGVVAFAAIFGSAMVQIHAWNYTTSAWDVVWNSGNKTIFIAGNIVLYNIKLDNPADYIDGGDEAKVKIACFGSTGVLWDIYLDYLRFTVKVENVVFDTIVGQYTSGRMVYHYNIADLTNDGDVAIAGHWNEYLLGLLPITGKVIESRGRALGHTLKGTSWMNVLRQVALSEGGTWWYDEGLHYIADLTKYYDVDREWIGWTRDGTSFVTKYYNEMQFRAFLFPFEAMLYKDMGDNPSLVETWIEVRTVADTSGDHMHIYIGDEHWYVDGNKVLRNDDDTALATLIDAKRMQLRWIFNDDTFELWGWVHGEQGIELLESGNMTRPSGTLKFQSEREHDTDNDVTAAVGVVTIEYEKDLGTPEEVTTQPGTVTVEETDAWKSVSIWGRKCLDQDDNDVTITVSTDNGADADHYIVDNETRTQANLEWKARSLLEGNAVDSTGLMCYPLSVDRKWSVGDYVSVDGYEEFIRAVQYEQDAGRKGKWTLTTGHVQTGVQKGKRAREAVAGSLDALQRS